MPASIRVDSGISLGTEYWIDRVVTRIGSDPECDICLPSAELDPHAVTLEYRGGVYRVYNRSASSIEVGGVTIRSGANAEWLADESVRLPDGVRLLLVVDGDSKPVPRQEPASDQPYRLEQSSNSNANQDSETDAPKKSKSSLIQLGVIGICVLAVGGMLMMKNGEGESTAPDRPTFDQIVDESLGKEESHRAIVRRLQYAQAALSRGNNVLARERFLKLRDQLVKHADTPNEDERELVERVLSYVEYRLGQL